jgi:hypothetical protein
MIPPGYSQASKRRYFGGIFGGILRNRENKMLTFQWTYLLNSKPSIGTELQFPVVSHTFKTRVDSGHSGFFCACNSLTRAIESHKIPPSLAVSVAVSVAVSAMLPVSDTVKPKGA